MLPRRLRPFVLLALLAAAAGCGPDAEPPKETMYVAAQQVTLRDRVAAVYNKVGTATNGEALEVLDRQKRFLKVRTPRGEEGWVEQRYLAEAKVFHDMQRLAAESKRLLSQGRASARNDVNMHTEPGRTTPYLYRIAEGEKLEVLKRATAERQNPQYAPGTDKPPTITEDWRLVRDQQGRTGWVLARMIDLEVPLEVAQYAEGQRIVAYFVLNEVEDEGRKVPQFLLALSEPKDGLPYDYDQLRVFTWNTARNRYETAYRERKLGGLLPITVGRESFEKEGTLPTFTIRVAGEGGAPAERKYKLNGVMVRRVLPPGEPPPAVPAGSRRKR